MPLTTAHREGLRVTGTTSTAVRGKGTESFEKDDDTSGSASRIDHQQEKCEER
jgi:hypothetical protein